MIEKTYQPGAVETRIYEAWEKAGAFRAGRPERAKAEPYCIVIPPPNVTGSLHMGHALNNTLQDILCRFERMRGKDVLWQPGTDHAGIATQAVVERQLMERQESSRAMGREAFIKRVWEWKAESGGIIIGQLKRLGASCDWSRERFTMDEGLSRAVLKVFVALYREGLIYKDKRLVNWDPKLKTAISDLEVQQVETKGNLWHIKYPIEGTDQFIVVATTRPETMLGDVAVAVHPENERLKHLIGKTAILPLVGRRIPIIGDTYADPEKGTGAVKITPAHDFNDFEVWQRHKDAELKDYKPINVLDREARINIQRNPDFHQGYYESYFVKELLKVDGRDRFEARKEIVELLEQGGFIEKIESHAHVVPHGDRSGAVLEPFLTDQWYVDAKTLAKPAISAVRKRNTVFVPPQWEATFFNWMENIQPWCISRQIWWGHQIPAWYGPKKQTDGSLKFSTVIDGGEIQPEDYHIFVEATEEDAVRAATKYYGREVIVTKDILDTSWVGSGKDHIFRDEDVLDTWFSSALWPFSTLGWPEKKMENLTRFGAFLDAKLLKLRKWIWRRLGTWCPMFLIPERPLDRFYPTSTLVTGFDIIFFWVARMMMMGLHFMKEVPFRDVYIHRLVRDEKGAKMSKSKGNVVDPLGIIDDYGADALRFTLARGVSPSHDIRLSSQQLEASRNFATKLWNAARFIEFNGARRVEGFSPLGLNENLNRWMARKVAVTIQNTTEAIEQYRFNDAADYVYHFVWENYCDQYVEASKSLLTGSDGPGKDETRAMAAWVLDQILKLLHPFMPFITEELWRVTGLVGPPRKALLALTDWPHALQVEDAIEMEAVFDVVGELRTIRTTYNVPFRETLSANLTQFGNANTSILMSSASSISRMANTAISVDGSEIAIPNWQSGTIQVVTVPSAGTAPSSTSFNFGSPSGAPIVRSPIRDGVVSVVMPASFDLDTERTRLAKEMAKCDADIARVDAKLNNPNFVARAPEEVVEEEKEKREEAQARKAKIAEALQRLKDSA
jgi:valyl-tRNA synthetase